MRFWNDYSLSKIFGSFNVIFTLAYLHYQITSIITAVFPYFKDIQICLSVRQLTAYNSISLLMTGIWTQTLRPLTVHHFNLRTPFQTPSTPTFQSPHFRPGCKGRITIPLNQIFFEVFFMIRSNRFFSYSLYYKNFIPVSRLPLRPFRSGVQR